MDSRRHLRRPPSQTRLTGCGFLAALRVSRVSRKSLFSSPPLSTMSTVSTVSTPRPKPQPKNQHRDRPVGTPPGSCGRCPLFEHASLANKSGTPHAQRALRSAAGRRPRRMQSLARRNKEFKVSSTVSTIVVRASRLHDRPARPALLKNPQSAINNRQSARHALA
jgi:hypothetical protein